MPICLRWHLRAFSTNPSKAEVYNMDAASNENWNLVHLRPNSEELARRNLQRQGVNVFSPFEEFTIRKANRLISSHRNLFPGYFFVQFDHHIVRFRSINSTIGVNRLVSFRDNVPARVPGALVHELMERCDAHGKIRPLSEISVGQAALIKKGPFADMVGNIINIDRQKRVWLLLDLLGREVHVSIDICDIQASKLCNKSQNL